MQSTKEKPGIMIGTKDVLEEGALTDPRDFAVVIDPVDPIVLKDLRTAEAMIVGHALLGIVIVVDNPGAATGRLIPDEDSAREVEETGSPFGRSALAKHARKF